MTRLRGAVLLVGAMALVAAGCGSSKKSTSASGKPAITIGSANFTESAMLADMYAAVLRKAGFSVSTKLNLGSREVLEPALESGQIDLEPEYAGNYLTFLDTKQGSLPIDQTVSALKTALQPKGLTVLNASPAADADAIGVTKATADKYHLTKISDLSSVASQLVLGGPPECATRITCELGLQQIYGLHFKSFKPLDAGGPLTKAALSNGDIQVARIFSSDSDIAVKGYVVLTDDKHFQQAGNIIPVIRVSKNTSEVTSLLNKVSAALTTDELVQLNKQMDDDKADPADVANQFLTSKKLI